MSFARIPSARSFHVEIVFISAKPFQRNELNDVCKENERTVEQVRRKSRTKRGAGDWGQGTGRPGGSNGTAEESNARFYTERSATFHQAESLQTDFFQPSTTSTCSKLTNSYRLLSMQRNPLVQPIFTLRIYVYVCMYVHM